MGKASCMQRTTWGFCTCANAPGLAQGFLLQPDAIVGIFAMLIILYPCSLKISQKLLLTLGCLLFYCFALCTTHLVVTAECRVRPKRQLRNGDMRLRP